ncbi:response regulator [Pilimelia columellifera]|uniref:Response regulator n=1 Tax=Pilimelia columellifera subsp. columellifera TaxID=706583 RepID=A0ABN3NSB9_9ACTN
MTTRVLFVDDEPRILDGLRRSLRAYRHRWEMAFATSGAQALEMLAATPHDIVLSDMRMPGMDGAELLTRISQNHPEVARVVLSGHTEPAAAIRVAIAGHRFLNKPADVEQVAGVITELTARPSRTAEVGDEGQRVRRAAGAVRSLPTPPEHLEQVRKLLGRPDGDLASAAYAVAHNVGLAAKLFQLAASPFFSSRTRVTSLGNAVAAVGSPTIRSLADTGELLWPGPTPRLAETVRQAVATADLVALIASPGNRPYAHAAALLQDVGRFARQPAGDPDVSTRAVGVELLRLWGLPTPVVAAVAQRDREHTPDASGLGVAAAVRAAYLLVQQTDARDPDDDAHDAELASLLAHPQLANAPTDWLRAADDAAARAEGWTAGRESRSGRERRS